MITSGILINERYELRTIISRGGMGEVWKANDVVLDRIVAIKIVNSQYLKENPKASTILYDEAKTGATLLGHPNVVTVLDFGTFKVGNDDTNYIVLEFVDGMTVADWINSVKPILDDETYYRISLLIAWEMCKAIGYAHRKGILHRDIKPLNAFLSNYGMTKMGDFGLARFIDEVTRTHTVAGAMSPAYSAPEQCRGDEKLTYRTDIYQLGCTLYHLFAGRLPFERKGIYAYIQAHMNDTPEPLEEYSELIPKELADQVMKALEKNPDDRVDLWRLHDAIATELQGRYKISIDIKGSTDEVIERIADITELSEESLKADVVNFEFPDFTEVLSESIMIVLAGVYSFKIAGVEKEIAEAVST